MSAPDTSTTAGKIAVMQHFEACGKIEAKGKKESHWWECSKPVWDWQNGDYRIAPEPKVAWWDVNTCPLGATVRHISSGNRYVITGATNTDAIVGSVIVAYANLAKYYEKLDPRSGNWSPAGTVEGGAI